MTEVQIIDDDDITEADVAAGCLQFYDGWKAGKNREQRDLGRHFIEMLRNIKNDDLKQLLFQALKVLDIDHYIKPSWIADEGPDLDVYEEPFETWRKTHPRDHSSPFWQPDRQPAPEPPPDTDRKKGVS